MRLLIKKPGQYPELEDFEAADTLSALQAAVGGYIQTVPITDKLVLVCDEDGKLKDKIANVALTNGMGGVYDYCVGTVAVVGLTDDGEEFRELTKHERAFATNWLDVRSIG